MDVCHQAFTKIIIVLQTISWTLVIALVFPRKIYIEIP